MDEKKDSPDAEPDRSVLTFIERKTGEAPRISLREEGSAEAGSPLIDPKSQEKLSLPQGRGTYQLMGEIARGGMGVVIKGHDTDLGRDVAMKVLNKDLSERPEVVQRFVEEAQIGGQLQHPGIVPVYELGLMADERPYFTMKLIKGRTLATLLSERKSPDTGRRRFLDIFESVCQTMAYAHSRGVIHRDLKPANVMVGAFGEVQVVDWGLAKVLARGGTADERKAREERTIHTVLETVRSDGSGSGTDSMIGSVMGTPAYMSPEQAQGQIDRLDERSDVFSLGAILCEILTGLPPYSAEGEKTLTNAARGRTDAAVERLEACDADKELVELAMECLLTSLAARPRNAGVVAERMQAYVASIEERAQAATIEAAEARVKAAEERRARKLTLGLAASVVATLGLGGGGWLWVQGERAAREREDAGRQRELAARVGETLEESARLSGMSLWNEALAVAESARTLVETGDADGSLAGRVADAVALRRSERDRAREEEARARETAELLHDLREIRQPEATIDAPIDWEQADRDYAAPFQRYGIEVDAGDPGEIAAAIQESGLGVEAALVFDEWTEVRRRKGDETGALRLLELAHLVDPDLVRADLREALANEDVEILRWIVEAGLENQPPKTLHMLGSALFRLGDAGQAREVYREAIRLHPDDSSLQLGMAHVLRVSEDREERLEAVGRFWAALALRPESVEIRQQLAKLYYDLGEIEKAAASYEEAHARRPGDRYLLYRIGWCLRFDDPERAERYFRMALEGSPREWWAAWTHAHLGTILRNRGELEEARGHLEEAVSIDTASYFLSELGFVYLAMGSLDEAAASFEEAIQTEVDYKWGFVNLAIVQRRQGDLSSAIASLERALEIDPGFVYARQELALTHLQAGDGDAAVRGLERFVALEPDNPESHATLGWSLFQKRDLDAAAASFENALELDPTHYVSHLRLGLVHIDREDYEAAIASFERCRELDPKSSGWANNIGVALERSGDLAGAAEWFTKAAAMDPEDHIAHRNAASIAEQMGDLDAAIDWYRKAVEIDDGNALTHHRFGNALKAKGLYEEAIAEWLRTAELAPDDAILRNAIAWELATSTIEGLRAPGAAVDLARRAVELRPEDAAIQNTLGVALYRAGQLEESVEVLLRSEELGDGDLPSDWLFLAMAYHRLDEEEEARRWYERALAWRSGNELDEESLRFLAEAEELLGTDASTDR